MQDLSRRSVMLAAPLIAVLPGTGRAGELPAPASPAPVPVVGLLVAWARPGRDGHTLIRIARMDAPDAPAETIGEWHAGPEDLAGHGTGQPMLRAARLANHLAVCVAAA